MADNSSDDSSSEVDILEESEDELNTTTYFHDDIEESTDDEDNKDLQDDYTEVPMDIVTSPPNTKYGSASTKNMVGTKKDGDDLDISIEDEKESTGDRALMEEIYAEISRKRETRKDHMISCPVCYEISIISKYSGLYDNIILACMGKNSK